MQRRHPGAEREAICAALKRARELVKLLPVIADGQSLEWVNLMGSTHFERTKAKAPALEEGISGFFLRDTGGKDTDRAIGKAPSGPYSSSLSEAQIFGKPAARKTKKALRSCSAPGI
jgi:hypothetical protein